jgi:hypothetical protein
MLGKASDIRGFQDRMGCLATIGALGAVDFPGYFPIEVVDRKINPPDREIRPFEKSAECPVGFFALLPELLDSLDVGFKFHLFPLILTPYIGIYQKTSGYTLSGNGALIETLKAVIKHTTAEVLPVFPELRTLESSVQLLIVCSHQVVAKSYQSGKAEFQVFVGTFPNIDHPVL